MCFVPQRRTLFRHLNVKKWSEPASFCTFDLEMCFAPQRRALFRHRNFQKWSVADVLCAFWLGNVLHTTTSTTACTFSTSQLPKAIPGWGVLYILTWKCASRHNDVHFFDISTSKSASKLRCFCAFWLGHVLRATSAWIFSSLTWPAGSAPAALASLLFDPPEPQIMGKKRNESTTFLPFGAPASSFFSLFLFSDLLISFLLLLGSCHLCFSISPYCGKFDF